MPPEMEKKQFSPAQAAWASCGWALAIVIVCLLDALLAGISSAPAVLLLRSGCEEAVFTLLPLFIVAKGCRVDMLAPLRMGSGAKPWRDPRALLLLLLAALLGWCIYPAMDGVQSCWTALLTFFHIPTAMAQVPELPDAGLKILAFFSLCLCPAFCEELCVRGHLLPALGRRLSVPAALGISALYFALMHGSLSAFLYTFLLGWIMGWIALRTRGLYPAMAFHLAFNLRGVAVSQAAYQGHAFTTELAALLFSSLLTAVALFALRMLTARPAAEEEPLREETPREWAGPLILAMIILGTLVLLSVF